MFKYYTLVIANAFGKAVAPSDELEHEAPRPASLTQLLPLAISALLLVASFFAELLLNSNICHKTADYAQWRSSMPLGLFIWDDKSWHHLLLPKSSRPNIIASIISVLQTVALFGILRSLPERNISKIAKGILFAACAAMVTLAVTTDTVTSADIYAYAAYSHLSLAQAYAPVHNMFSSDFALLNTLPDHLWYAIGPETRRGLEPAPYGPLWLGFAHLTLGWTQNLATTLYLSRVVNILAFVGCIFALRTLQLPGALIAMFALNPALIFHFIADGHNDIIAVALILFGFGAARTMPWLGTVIAAMAGLIKLPYLLPSILVARAFQQLSMKLLAGIAILVTVAAGSWLWGGHAYLYGLTHHVQGNTTGETHFHWALHALFVLADLIGVGFAVLFGRYFSPITYMFPTLFAVVHPWYLMAGLPYALQNGGAAFTIFLLFLPLLSFEMDIVYNPSIISYLLFTGLIVIGCVGAWRRFKNNSHLVRLATQARQAMQTHRAALTIVAGFVLLILGFLKIPIFPIDDSATFEYYGNAVIHGKRLYVDLFDNKLPSIYYLNALYQALMPKMYALHLVIELLINGLSAYLFFRIARFYRLLHAEITALLFLAIITFAPRHLNTSEQYAIALTLGAIYSFCQKRSFWSGILIALAATFWIPSALLGCWLLFKGTRREKVLLGTAYLVVAAALLASIETITGGHLAGLFVGWHAYLQSDPQNNRLQPLLRRLYASLGDVMITPILLCCLALMQRSRAPYFFDLIAWSLCAFVGAFLSLRLYPHYFLPAIAPLLLLTSSFISRDFPKSAITHGRLPIWRIAVLLLAAFMLLRSMRAEWRIAKEVKSYDIERREMGGEIIAALGPNATVETVGRYAPEIFLGADALPTSPTGIVGSAITSAKQEGVYSFPDSDAGLVLLYQRSAFQSIPPGYVQVPSRSPRWRVYVKGNLAPRFLHEDPRRMP